MKSCTEYQNAFLALLDGEAAPDMRAHVQACPACRAAFEALKALDARLHTLGAVSAQNAPEVDLVDAVMQGVSELKCGAQAVLDPDSSDAGLMAYIEDELDDLSRARMERMLDAQPAVRAEVVALAALHAELQAIGDMAAACAPEVNLVGDVMRSITLAKAPEAKSVPLRPRPRVHQRSAPVIRRWQWAVLAAAASLVLGLWFVTSGLLSPSEDDVKVAQGKQAQPLPGKATKPVDFQATTPLSREGETPSAGGSDIAPPVSISEGSGPAGPKAEPKNKGITLQDAINKRREMLLKDPAAFSQWASLTPDEARQLLQQAGLSPEAIVGLAQWLPAEEAAGYLRSAVKQNPNDPYLRYALAKTLASTPNGAAESLLQLGEWGQKDSQNGLPHYMEARVRFAQGDNEGALNALTNGAGRSGASPYSLQTARNQQEALVASGMNPDAAKYVAASTAGGREYVDLVQLGKDLVQYGNYYESIGDHDTAQQIYQGARQLGAQLVEGATLASEQQAGYETELTALDALKEIYTMLQDPDTLHALEAAYTGVLEGLSQLVEFIGSLDELLIHTPVQSTRDLVSQILQGGNLALPQQ